MKSKKEIPSNTLLPHTSYLNYNTDDLEGEIWKSVQGQDRFYSVSNKSRIAKASSNSDVKIIEQILRKSDGAPKFQINRTWYLTQDIVSTAFQIDNPYGFTEIIHINGIKTDNRPENLEYAEIDSDAIVSPYVMCDFTRIPSASASASQVVKINKLGVRLAAYNSVKSAAEREGKTLDKMFSLLKTGQHSENVTWLYLREYFRTERFKKQARLITSQQTMVHPFLM